MSEYGDGGAPPAEAEVEDNRPLQERIGDKVKIEYYVVSYWQVLLRNHLLAKFQKLSLCRLDSCATATGRVQSMHREMLKSSTGWLTLHMMVWYWHSYDVSCNCECCATLLITSRRETEKSLFMPDKICCEIRQKWRWLQRYGWCSTASLSYVRHSSALCCAVMCCAVMCCGMLRCDVLWYAALWCAVVCFLAAAGEDRAEIFTAASNSSFFVKSFAPLQQWPYTVTQSE